MKRITIEDVAKKAGVSKGTVSAVINARQTVKTATRQRVLDVMKKLNYRPKGIARDLKAGAYDKSIGMIVKDLNYPFYTAIASGAKEFAESKGYLLFIASSENVHSTEKEIIHLYATKDIKGAIIAPVNEGTSEIEHLFQLKTLNYPFVLLEDVKGIQSNVVTIDNIQAVKKAVKYLLELGHTKIVHFAGPPNASHTGERVDGFRLAFSESSVVFSEEMIVPCGSNFELSYSTCKDYFNGLQPRAYPTAIVCFNDQQALGILTALKEMKIRVPGKISIIGNDDINYAEIYPVPLTTIRAPKREIGRKAAEILIRNIEASSQPKPEKVVLETELIIRESTRKR